MKLTTLYEDNDFWLINKPPFISTLEDRTSDINILSLARMKEPDAQVCHRLDKDTSGVLAIARNPEAYRHLSMQFEHRTVKKLYHAVVDGQHEFSESEVNAPLLKQNDGTVRISSKGKEATTSFNTLEVFLGHTLVACRPVTGRMHQIRVHLASLKAPITGDELYGGKPFFVSMIKRGFRMKKDEDEQPLMKRMALHAAVLEFQAMNGSVVAVSAAYPKDFSALVNQLRKSGR